MSQHHYPREALVGDYTRGGVGFVLTGLGAGLSSGPLAWILGVIALMFAVFAYRTWRRQAMVIELDDRGLSTRAPSQVSLPWNDLSELKLKYFSTKRDGSGGWMQLSLKADNAALSFESTVTDFRDIVGRAEIAAMDNRLELDPATISNLQTFDFPPAASPDRARLKS